MVRAEPESSAFPFQALAMRIARFRVRTLMVMVAMMVLLVWRTMMGAVACSLLRSCRFGPGEITFTISRGPPMGQRIDDSYRFLRSLRFLLFQSGSDTMHPLFGNADRPAQTSLEVE